MTQFPVWPTTPFAYDPRNDVKGRGNGYLVERKGTSSTFPTLGHRALYDFYCEFQDQLDDQLNMIGSRPKLPAGTVELYVGTFVLDVQHALLLAASQGMDSILDLSTNREISLKGRDDIKLADHARVLRDTVRCLVHSLDYAVDALQAPAESAIRSDLADAKALLTKLRDAT